MEPENDPDGNDFQHVIYLKNSPLESLNMSVDGRVTKTPYSFKKADDKQVTSCNRKQAKTTTTGEQVTPRLRRQDNEVASMSNQG